MKRFKILSLVLFLLAGVSVTTAQEFAGFDEYADKVLTDWSVPGAAVAVVKDDEIVFARGYGIKELGKTEKVDTRTIFAVASNTKAFTATAIAILIDEGKLNWDDKVIDHLPDFNLADPYVTKEITIRDLLSHRSGLPAYGGDITWWGGSYSRDEIVRRVRFVEPRFGFRAAYSYQNIPFIIAGQIIAKVSGMSWDDFVISRILKPLKMADTTTTVRALSKQMNRVEPHFRDLETGRVFPIEWRNLDNGGAAAGLNSNVMDMAQWLRFQLNEGKSGVSQLVSVKNLRETHSLQTIIPNPPTAEPRLQTNFRAYGLGWSLREYAGHKIVWHNGWADGQLSMTAMIPDKKIGVVVLTNIHSGNAYLPLVYRLLDQSLGLENKDWNGYFLKSANDQRSAFLENEKKLERERPKDTRPSAPLSIYACIYRNQLYGDIKVFEENGGLVVQLMNSPTYIGNLVHWHNDKFRVVWRDPVGEKTFLTFKVSPERSVESMKLAMSGFIDDAEYEYKVVD